MEHTDAGVHTVLADVERPAEHHHGPVREAESAARPLPVPAPAVVASGTVPPRPVAPSVAAVVPPVMPGGADGPGRSGAEQTGAGQSEAGYDAQIEDLDDDLDDDDLDDDEDLDGDTGGAELARPDGVTARSGDGSLADSLAQVIDIGLGDLLGEAMEWQERALCAQTDPEAFFPEKGGSTREAKRICSGCEVRVECLEYALENDERFGIWGGMSERERRKQRRRAV